MCVRIILRMWFTMLYTQFFYSADENEPTNKEMMLILENDENDGCILCG